MATSITIFFFFLEEHGLLIKEALIEHFESDEPRSYLKLIQEVCHEKLSLCSLGKQAKDDFVSLFKFFVFQIQSKL